MTKGVDDMHVSQLLPNCAWSKQRRICRGNDAYKEASCLEVIVCCFVRGY